MEGELRKRKGKLLNIDERINLPINTKVILENPDQHYIQIYRKGVDGDFYIVDGQWGRYSANFDKVNIYELK